MDFAYKLGRLPNDPSKPRLKLASFLTSAAPTYPENRDWLTAALPYDMLGNDYIGDCTCVTAAHIIQSLSKYGQSKDVRLTLDQVIQAYSAVSGYDPNTGANDNGAVIQDVLNYWRKTGIGGHKILAFAEVDYNDKEELFGALNMFGTIYLGIDFPNTAMDQFNREQPWDYVEGAKSEGGHAINAGYYDVSDQMWKVVTWGRVQPMTQAFFDHYVFEAWVVITPEWFNEQGNSPIGLNMYALGEQFEKMTGEDNPFPEPQPAPEPPAPEPTPLPAEDVALMKAAEDWLNGCPWFYKRQIQEPLKAWLAVKRHKA